MERNVKLSDKLSKVLLASSQTQAENRKLMEKNDKLSALLNEVVFTGHLLQGHFQDRVSGVGCSVFSAGALLYVAFSRDMDKPFVILRTHLGMEIELLLAENQTRRPIPRG